MLCYLAQCNDIAGKLCGQRLMCLAEVVVEALKSISVCTCMIAYFAWQICWRLCMRNFLILEVFLITVYVAMQVA